MNRESGFFELVLEQRGALALVVTELGEAPNLPRDALVRSGIGIDERDDLDAVGGRRFARHSAGQRDTEGDEKRPGGEL
ncbi:MAG: hypothetical protein ACYDAH_17450 [Steroidobacteraceae bacterium]